MVHALTLSIAQRLALSLATSLLVPVVLISAGNGYGVMEASEFDGDPAVIVAEYDILAG